MKKIIEIYKFIDGYKTYIIAIIIAVLNLLAVTGVLPQESLEAINYVLVALGLGALRSGVKKGTVN